MLSPEPGAYAGPRPTNSTGQPISMLPPPPAKSYNRMKPTDVASLSDNEHQFLPPHLKVYARLAKERRLKEESVKNETTLARASIAESCSSPPPGTSLSPAAHVLAARKPKTMEPDTRTASDPLPDKESTQHLESSPAQPSPKPNTPPKDEAAETDKGKGSGFEAICSTWAWKIPAAATLSDSSGGSHIGDDNAPLSKADRVKNGESSSQPTVSRNERTSRRGVRIGDNVYLSSEN